MANTPKKSTNGASMMGYGALAVIIGFIITGISYSMHLMVARTSSLPV